MKSIAAIRYIDALYSTAKEIKSTDLEIYIGIGRIIVSSGHVLICFTEENDIPIRGLLVPKEAIILEKKKVYPKLEKADLSNHIGLKVGIFWQDIVYFENGKVPDKPTQMYTEGEVFLENSHAIIIKNPDTIKIRRGNLNNHPEAKSTFLIVPKTLITGIELYDKKL